MPDELQPEQPGEPKEDGVDRDRPQMDEKTRAKLAELQHRIDLHLVDAMPYKFSDIQWRQAEGIPLQQRHVTNQAVILSRQRAESLGVLDFVNMLGERDEIDFDEVAWSGPSDLCIFYPEQLGNLEPQVPAPLIDSETVKRLVAELDNPKFARLTQIGTGEEPSGPASPLVS